MFADWFCEPLGCLLIGWLPGAGVAMSTRMVFKRIVSLCTFAWDAWLQCVKGVFVCLFYVLQSMRETMTAAGLIVWHSVHSIYFMQHLRSWHRWSFGENSHGLRHRLCLWWGWVLRVFAKKSSARSWTQPALLVILHLWFVFFWMKVHLIDLRQLTGQEMPSVWVINVQISFDF